MTESKMELLEQAISDSDSVYFPVSVAITVAQEHGEYEGNEYDEEDKLLNSQEKENLKEIVADKIDEAASQGTLLETPHTSAILRNWSEWSNSEIYVEWTSEITQDYQGLLQFISQFRKEIRYSAGGTSGSYDILDPSPIKHYLDLNATANRLEKMTEEELTDDETRTKELFLRGKQILDDGKDPGDPGTWSNTGKESNQNQ